jgi:hypothetical protein
VVSWVAGDVVVPVFVAWVSVAGDVVVPVFVAWVSVVGAQPTAKTVTPINATVRNSFGKLIELSHRRGFFFR